MNVKTLLAVFLLCAGCSQAQETLVVPLGKGSYASLPPSPSKEVKAVLERPLYTLDEKRAMPRCWPVGFWPRDWTFGTQSQR